jgi:hypothetical protein
MPRYYFDIQDAESQRDEEGMECEDVEVARGKVMASLPDLAEFISQDEGDSQFISVLVRDEEGHQVYAATLTFFGYRLDAAARQ